MTVIVELFKSLVDQGAIRSKNIIGCTDEEINIVEGHIKCVLPRAYRDFLKISGKGCGKLFTGSDIYYPRLLELQSEAAQLMSENNLPSLLPGNAKVFYMHQGYELNYFQPISDDPAIFQWWEGQKGSVKNIVMAWPSFSAFIAAVIQGHCRQWPDLNP